MSERYLQKDPKPRKDVPKTFPKPSQTGPKANEIVVPIALRTRPSPAQTVRKGRGYTERVQDNTERKGRGHPEPEATACGVRDVVMT